MFKQIAGLKTGASDIVRKHQGGSPRPRAGSIRQLRACWLLMV